MNYPFGQNSIIHYPWMITVWGNVLNTAAVKDWDSVREKETALTAISYKKGQ